MCEECEHRIAPVPQRCYKCKKQSPDSLTCVQCRKTSSLTAVWAVSDFAEPLDALIDAYKFDHKRALALPLASLLSERLAEYGKARDDWIITNVPTSPARVRQRGFDHTALLAKKTAYKTRLIYLPLLARIGKARQVGAKRQERIEQVKGMYFMHSRFVLNGSSVVLIDDVVTTGATLEECARVCKAAGAKKVYGLVLAQKL